MSPKDRLWSFIEYCEDQTSADAVGEHFLVEMSGLGFPYVALASHVDPLAPPSDAVMVLRYPEAWVAHFSAEEYQRFDPVFDYASRQFMPFRWTEGRFLARLSKQQMTVLAEGREAGLEGGATIPIRGSDALPASCSLIPDPGGVDPENFKLAHAMAVYAHERARRIKAKEISARSPPLTKRERECLVLVARGESDWEIGKILGVSASAVNRTVERGEEAARRSQPHASDHPRPAYRRYLALRGDRISPRATSLRRQKPLAKRCNLGLNYSRLVGSPCTW